MSASYKFVTTDDDGNLVELEATPTATTWLNGGLTRYRWHCQVCGEPLTIEATDAGTALEAHAEDCVGAHDYLRCDCSDCVNRSAAEASHMNDVAASAVADPGLVERWLVDQRGDDVADGEVLP